MTPAGDPITNGTNTIGMAANMSFCWRLVTNENNSVEPSIVPTRAR